MERVFRAPPLGRRIGEWRDDLGDLEKRPRPSVDEHERRGVGPPRSLVHEMNLHTVDRCLELRQLIEAALLLTPVERGPPVRDELLQIGEIRPVLPTRAVDLIGKTRPCQPLLQIRQNRVRHVDPEGDDRVAVGLRPGCGSELNCRRSRRNLASHCERRNRENDSGGPPSIDHDGSAYLPCTSGARRI